MGAPDGQGSFGLVSVRVGYIRFGLSGVIGSGWGSLVG
jgi:hypothetical protein